MKDIPGRHRGHMLPGTLWLILKAMVGIVFKCHCLFYEVPTQYCQMLINNTKSFKPAVLQVRSGHSSGP